MMPGYEDALVFGGNVGSLPGAEIPPALRGGSGPNSLEVARETANNHGRLQERISERILKIVARIEASWEGDGASAAHSAIQPLAAATKQTAMQLNDAQKGHEGQGHAFSEVSNKVEDIPAHPPERGFVDEFTPWDTDTEEEINAYNATAQRNVDAYDTYKQQSHSNAAAMPTQWAQFSQGGGEFEVADTGGSDGGTTASGYSAPGGTAGASGGGFTPTSGGGGASAVSPGLGAITGGGGGGSVASPGPVTGSGPINGSAAGLPFGPGGGGTSGGRGVGMGMPLMGAMGAGGAGGDKLRTNRGYGPRGGGGMGGSSAAPRVGGGSGPGGAAKTGAMPGGAKTGAMPGGAAAAESAAAKGAATGGRGGVAGAPMAGAGRGQGSDDEDHERKTLLIEPERDELFGTNEMTAPPVIGE